MGIGGAIAMLAGLGIFELRAGRARMRILVSIVAEALLVVGIVWVEWRGR